MPKSAQSPRFPASLVFWGPPLVAIAVAGFIFTRAYGAHFAAHPIHAPNWAVLAAAPAIIQVHIAAAVISFLVGVVLLTGVKGSGLHKKLGWTWVVAMAVTAITSFFIKELNPGQFSFVHLVAGYTVIAMPMAIAAIRRKNVASHRRTMTYTFVGGMLIAGLFTFMPGRLMYLFLFG